MNISLASNTRGTLHPLRAFFVSLRLLLVPRRRVVVPSHLLRPWRRLSVAGRLEVLYVKSGSRVILKALSCVRSTDRNHPLLRAVLAKFEIC